MQSSRIRTGFRIGFLLLSAFTLAPPCIAASLEYADHVYDYDKVRNRLYFGGAPYANFLERSDEGRALYTIDLTTGERTKIFETAADNKIRDYKSAPPGGIVALREEIFRRNVPPHEANCTERIFDEETLSAIKINCYENRVLRIVTAEGKEIVAFDKVREYIWSPDGSKVAYATGDFVSHQEGWSATGTYVYDLAMQEANRIHPSGLRLFWAKFDGNLYIQDQPGGRSGGVLRYNPRSDRLEPTKHKGIRFSPDGRYYYTPGTEGIPFDIFRSATDEGIARNSPALSGLSSLDEPIGWAPDRNRLLIPTSVRPMGRANSDERMIFVYDADEDKGVAIPSEGVISWGDTADEVVLYRESIGMERKNLKDIQLK